MIALHSVGNVKSFLSCSDTSPIIFLNLFFVFTSSPQNENYNIDFSPLFTLLLDESWIHFNCNRGRLEFTDFPRRGIHCVFYARGAPDFVNNLCSMILHTKGNFWRSCQILHFYRSEPANDWWRRKRQKVVWFAPQKWNPRFLKKCIWTPCRRSPYLNVYIFLLIICWIVELPGTHFWIGASEDREGVWTWETGQPLFYSRWVIGQPDSLTELNCAFLAAHQLLYWRDGNCSAAFFYICEKDVSST